MSRIKDGTYTTDNNYGAYTNKINSYINKLYTNSLNLYVEKYQGNNSTGTQAIDIEKLEESLSYIDDYLYYFFKFNQDDFYSIYVNLATKLNSITVLSKNERGLFGRYEEKKNTLYINPLLRSSKELSSSERIRLYICHELGHIQNSKWMNNVLPFLYETKCSNEERQLMYDGFSLLDEATTQDRAEDITYYYSSKRRTIMAPRVSELYNGHQYESNFDFYGEFQTPTIAFAKTLRGIGKINNDYSVMRELDRQAIDENFSKRIIDEYFIDGQILNLHKLLKNLGIIKNASYASFGHGDEKYLRQSYSALLEYNQLAAKMKDTRDPISTKRT